MGIYHRLIMYVGRNLQVVKESNGSFSVKGDTGISLVSSAFKKEHEAYCPEEKLAPHVGHEISCVTYGLGKPVNVSIECEDCCEVIFDVDAD